MIFYTNLDIHAAMHFWHEWRIAGRRCRLIPQGAGRWLVAALIT
jgi:hypothetical protein